MKTVLILAIFFQNTLIVDEGFKQSNLHPYISIYRDSVQLSIDEVVQRYNNGLFTVVANEDIAFPPGPFYYYLHYSVGNTTTHPIELYCEVKNPHLNHVQLFFSAGYSYKHSVLTGDYLAFENREIRNRFFVFETSLGQGEHRDFFLVTDKYNESIQIPITLRTKDNFIENTNYESTVLGAYFGAILIIFLAAIVISIINPRKLNLLFIVYLLGFSLFTFSQTGFGYQFLWGSAPLFNSLSRSFFALVSNAATLIFVYHFFEMKYEKKWVLKTHWIVTFYVAVNWILHIVYYSLIFYRDSHQHWINYNFLQIGVFLFPIYLMGLSLYEIIQYNRTKYYFFLLSIIGMLTAIGIMMLGQMGLVKDYFILENITLVALIVDFSILGGILSTDLYKIKLSNQKLISNLDQAIADGARNFLRGQQNERSRLSQEIHDGTGVRLSAIQMRLSTIETNDNEQRDRILGDLSIVSKDLRKFSHNLSSVVLEEFGLVNAVEELILSLEEVYCDMKFEFDYEPLQKIDPLIEKELYFILSELINNSIKHSGGTHIDLSLTSTESAIKFSYRDNGVGIDTNEMIKGIGIRNINWRLNILNGKIDYVREKEYNLFQAEIPI